MKTISTIENEVHIITALHKYSGIYLNIFIAQFKNLAKVVKYGHLTVLTGVTYEHQNSHVIYLRATWWPSRKVAVKSDIKNMASLTNDLTKISVLKYT